MDKNTIQKSAQSVDKKQVTIDKKKRALRLCAQDETRTHTILRPLPPQSSVYTNFTTCAYVPRTGLEPAHLAACAPETHASTNSAIWACEPVLGSVRKEKQELVLLFSIRERKTRLELATPTLARSCSTN